MAKVYVKGQEMTAIGDALRETNVTEDGYLPSEMTDAILDAMTKFAPKNKASGETIAVSDAEEWKMLGMTAYGKSSQNTVPGNQLATPSTDKLNTTVSVATLTIVDDIITINLEEDSVTKALTFMFNLTTHSLEVGKTYSVRLYDVNNNIIGKTDGIWQTFFRQSMIENITITEDMVSDINFNKYYIQTNNNITVAKGTYRYKILVCESDKIPNTWEPYVGGIPSPNPDYPQEIVSCGDDGNIEYDVLKSNLVKGVTYNSSGKRYYPLVKGGDLSLIKKGQTYTLSATMNAEADTVCYANNNSKLFNAKEFSLKAGTNRIKYTFIALNDGLISDTTNIINKGYSLDDGVVVTASDFMITLFDNTVYEEFNSQPLTLSTPDGFPGIPLGTTIPDVIKNSEIHMSGVWWDEETSQYYISDTVDVSRGKSVQRIVKCTPIAPITFKNRDDNGRCYVSNYGIFKTDEAVFVLTQSNGGRAMSTFASWSSWGSGADGTFTMSSDIIYYKDSTKTLDEVNAMFAELGTNFEIYGISPSPLETDLTESEIQQYKALMMNSPNTTIVNDSGVYTEVTYLPLINESEVS